MDCDSSAGRVKTEAVCLGSEVRLPVRRFQGTMTA